VGVGAYCQTSDGSFHSGRWQAVLNYLNNPKTKGGE
jgi:hypothetical protein